MVASPDVMHAALALDQQLVDVSGYSALDTGALRGLGQHMLGQNAARASECLHLGTRRFGVAFVCYGVSAGIERRNVSRIATERRPFIQDLKRFPQTSDVVRIAEPDQDRYGLGK
jgi:hypothetical protein